MPNVGTWQIDVAGQDQSLVSFLDLLKRDPISGGKNFMEVTGYGSPDVAFLDLGGRHRVRKMTMTRFHPTHADAYNWYENDAHAYEGVADVTETHIDYTGTETEWVIAGAKIEITVEEPLGLTTTTTITITGGQAVLQA